MRKLIILAALSAIAPAGMSSAQQPDVLGLAAEALGVAKITTLQYTGSGASFSVGQNFAPNEPWPRVTVKNYTALINYDTASMRQEIVRERGATMPRGGGAPFTGEQRQIQVVSGNYAWNVPVPPAAPAGAPPAGGGGPGAERPPQPAAAAQADRMLALWATPQGFVKAALANKSSTKKAEGGTEVSFVVGGKYRMTGLINAQHQVKRVRTWIDNPIVGDMPVETVYSDYQDFGGVQFPAHIAQSQDGYPSLDLTIASVTANPPIDIKVPDNVSTAQTPPITVKSQQLAEGVFYLTGGTHHSLAVEMKDHIVLIDTPNNENRALAVIAKSKELIPNKPIRYVVTTHHHWDHLGGIRTAMDEGATIVTHRINKAFLQRVAKTPHTIGPDRLAASRKPLRIQTFGDTGKLTDGARTIELFQIAGNRHAADLSVVYLPQEKILAEVDAYTPPAEPNAPLAANTLQLATALYDTIQNRKLEVRTIVPFHGNRTAELAELAKAVGKGAASSN